MGGVGDGIAWSGAGPEGVGVYGQYKQYTTARYSYM